MSIWTEECVALVDSVRWSGSRRESRGDLTRLRQTTEAAPCCPLQVSDDSAHRLFNQAITITHNKFICVVFSCYTAYRTCLEFDTFRKRLLEIVLVSSVFRCWSCSNSDRQQAKKKKKKKGFNHSQILIH